MKCPNCSETLLMTERNHIEIDYCPSCRGVWLDKGELDKLLDYAAQPSSTGLFNQRSSLPDHYQDTYKQYPHGYKKPYKKRSFLGDLFDFD